MIKHSCCLCFLTAAVSGGVGIRSPTWITAGCCIFFLLVAFVCSHPTFECYIIYMLNVLFTMYFSVIDLFPS